MDKREFDDVWWEVGTFPRNILCYEECPSNGSFDRSFDRFPTVNTKIVYIVSEVGKAAKVGYRNEG